MKMKGPIGHMEGESLQLELWIPLRAGREEEGPCVSLENLGLCLE